ncbi:hypothetical protein RHMOL_Rhmol06G0171600 [Rhododendron molle]|uniref:Uncharacterized protein n=1 Tax=Rhododendron molle TaxID=49168 RepID=A0ACC0NDH8_RHOML|nr:hypothetical protein RHMOL_Rhmol06G0171600 [Rhododendron molle]
MDIARNHSKRGLTKCSPFLPGQQKGMGVVWTFRYRLWLSTGVTVQPSREIRDEFGAFNWAASFAASLSCLSLFCPCLLLALCSSNQRPLQRTVARILYPINGITISGFAISGCFCWVQSDFARLGLAWICGYGCYWVGFSTGTQIIALYGN